MSGMEDWPRCKKPVPDGMGGGERCNEPSVTKDLDACYDHAEVCRQSGCDEPRNPWEIFCPVHRNEALESGLRG